MKCGIASVFFFIDVKDVMCEKTYIHRTIHNVHLYASTWSRSNIFIDMKFSASPVHHERSSQGDRAQGLVFSLILSLPQCRSAKLKRDSYVPRCGSSASVVFSESAMSHGHLLLDTDFSTLNLIIF